MKKRVRFNATHNYDHLTFNGGEEYELTQQQYDNMNGLDVNGMPFTQNNVKLFVDVTDLKPKEKV